VRISGIEWTEGDVAHLARHGVRPDEVEEVLAGSPVWRRGRKHPETGRKPDEVEEVLAGSPVWRRGRKHPETGRKSLYVLGKTEGGRYLFVVLSPRGRGRARCVTAMDMDEKARRYYDRHRR